MELKAARENDRAMIQALQQAATTDSNTSQHVEENHSLKQSDTHTYYTLKLE